ncbi:glycoside hydrolase/deacetylase [Anaeromyces robustus]|jgi:peptidoglycan/xylan/chitin deacetylase (PgdA/CDA1 family)|uniref:Glycoside hydrolase/deacetylase n=1 Tax=Anaeromyces robustus TaxID=1754192 RepID=A0A1Y1X4G7_9FUNG|nr:glycoside hydrolase/deacetylase [Anaeromyces robustus]|eukprot:ORX80214.1 glycoside hydrolase/deacetylase [Anaeromyces robustus]
MKFFNAAIISILAVSALAQDTVQSQQANTQQAATQQANTQATTQQAAAPQSNQPQAEIIYHCTVPNTIAFTIDDGPTEKTPELLAALKDAGIVATFYVNGANAMKDPSGEPLPQVKPFIKDIYDAGHEIGSHTYNHACLTEQCHLNNPTAVVMDSKEVFTDQIVKNEDLIFDAIGVYPATYRAPFGDGQNPGVVNNTLLEWLYDLGYPYAIHWDIETKDMENSFSGGDDFAFAEAKTHYEGELSNNDKLITLQHAIPVTIEKIIPYVKNVWMPAHPNMKFVKVSECLGLPSDAVYKKTKGPVIKPNDPDNKLTTSDATMIKAYVAIVISTLFTIFYLF